MRTLQTVLDDDFTPEMHMAWQKAYDAIAEAMINSAYPCVPASAGVDGVASQSDEEPGGMARRWDHRRAS